MKRHFANMVFALILIAYTVYAALDTFVIVRVLTPDTLPTATAEASAAPTATESPAELAATAPISADTEYHDDQIDIVLTTPGSIQTDTAGRITSYKDAAGNTHSFTYESVDLSKLTEAERAALEKAAKQEGWKTENLTASLTRVSWKVESPRIETPQTTPIENGETVNLVNDNNWSPPQVFRKP